MQLGGSHFFVLSLQPHFYGLKMKLSIIHAPFGEFLNCAVCSLVTAVEADSSLIEQPHNTHCIAACYN